MKCIDCGKGVRSNSHDPEKKRCTKCFQKLGKENTISTVVQNTNLPAFSSLFSEKEAVAKLHNFYQKGQFTKEQFIQALQS